MRLRDLMGPMLAAAVVFATPSCGSDAECGNGDVEDGEGCDDGNRVGGDGCSASCANEMLCGNGVVDPGESCDDANADPGDGCDACRSTQFGVTPDFNVCPLVDGLNVVPPSIEVGRAARLSAEVSDVDDGAVTLTWTSTAGLIQPLNDLSALYQCTQPGVYEVEVVAADDQGCRVDDTSGVAKARVRCR